MSVGDDPTSLTGKRFTLGAWIVDPASDELRRGGRVVKLEPRNMLLLLALARRAGEVVTFDELLDAVWPGLVVTQSSVYQGVAQLRKLLGENRATPDYIATIPRKGYRLVARVAAADRGAVPPVPPPPEPVLDADTGVRDPGPPDPPPPPASWPDRRRFVVASVAVAAAAGAAGWWIWREAGPPSGIVRIAVLPFADRSEAHLQQAAADGLANDVIHRFERTDGVRVLARNSSFTFRDVTDEASLLQAVHRQLEAEYALTGTLTRGRGRTRVGVRLFRLGTGKTVWTSDFDEPDERLADLPGAIATGALQALRIPTPRAAEANPLDAYELYLLGLNALHTQQTIEGIYKARGYFTRATETDAGYARAYAGLADTWIAQANYGFGISLRDAGDRAQPLIDKALSIDAELLEGLLTQGKLFLLTRWNEIVRGRAFVQKAVDLYPGSAEARFDLGVSYAYDAQPRSAIPHYAAALSLDPLNYLIHSRWGQDATFSGDYDAARAHFARAGTLMPKHPWRFLGPGQADYARGRLDDAVANYRLQLEQDPRRPDVWSELAGFYLDLGMTADARAAYEKKRSLRDDRRYAAIDESRVLLGEGNRALIAGRLDAMKLDRPFDGQWEIDRLTMLAIAGRPPAHEALDALAAAMRTDPWPWVGSYWVFFGQMAWIDLAALYDRIGARDAARPLLDQAQVMLERLRTDGNVFHAIAFLEARIAALRGQVDAAIVALGRAVDIGWRSAWLLPFDLALSRVVGDPRIGHLVQRVRAELDGQRRHLG